MSASTAALLLPIRTPLGSPSATLPDAPHAPLGSPAATLPTNARSVVPAAVPPPPSAPSFVEPNSAAAIVMREFPGLAPSAVLELPDDCRPVRLPSAEALVVWNQVVKHERRAGRLSAIAHLVSGTPGAITALPRHVAILSFRNRSCHALVPMSAALRALVDPAWTPECGRPLPLYQIPLSWTEYVACKNRGAPQPRGPALPPRIGRGLESTFQR